MIHKTNVLKLYLKNQTFKYTCHVNHFLIPFGIFVLDYVNNARLKGEEVMETYLG